MDNKSIIPSAPLVLPTWTNHDHSLFLHAVANGPDDIAGQWSELASAIPGKTADEVKAYYEAVELGLLEIEAGRVELPHYPDEDDYFMGKQVNIGMVKKDKELVGNELLATVIGSKRVEKERRRAIPWTEDEHKKFLLGMQIYGKGDWRSIARNMVGTRTATQVASHAQKYFLRQASLKEDKKEEEDDDKKKKKKRRRASIHDITTADAVVQAQPSSSSAPTTSLNGGGQGRGEPAVIPITSPSPIGSQERGESSLTVWPSVNGKTDTDSTMVVNAQPISSTPPATSTFYGGSEVRSVPIAVTTPSSPPYFCGGQGIVGAPQPLNSFYDGHVGGAQSHPTTLPDTNFYGEQGQAPRYEFIKHLAPSHVADYSLHEEFSF